MKEQTINSFLKHALTAKGLRKAITEDPLSFLKDMGIPLRDDIVPLDLSAACANNAMLGAYRP